MAQLTPKNYANYFYFPGTIVSGTSGLKIRGNLKKYLNVDSVPIPYGRLIAKDSFDNQINARLPNNADDVIVGITLIDSFQFVPSYTKSFSEIPGYPVNSYMTVFEKGFFSVAVETGSTFDPNASFDTIYFGYSGDDKGKISNVAGGSFAALDGAIWDSIANQQGLNGNNAIAATIVITETLDTFEPQPGVVFGLESPIELSEINNNSVTLTSNLNTQPTDDVDVTFTSTDPTEVLVDGGADTTLTFTPENWNVNQSVEITIPLDASSDTSVPIEITTTSTDPNYNNLVVDDFIVNVDAFIQPVIQISPTSLTMDENTSQQLTATLLSDVSPTDDVIVTFTSNDIAIATITGSPLTFTSLNWMTPQSVIVNALEVLVDDNTTIDVTATSSDPAWNT